MYGIFKRCGQFSEEGTMELKFISYHLDTEVFMLFISAKSGDSTIKVFLPWEAEMTDAQVPFILGQCLS